MDNMQKGRLRGWRRGLFLVLSLLAMTARAQENVAWGKWQTWGEQKDGTFRNPVMPAGLPCPIHPNPPF